MRKLFTSTAPKIRCDKATAIGIRSLIYSIFVITVTFMGELNAFIFYINVCVCVR